jgi:hypothetical protein
MENNVRNKSSRSRRSKQQVLDLLDEFERAGLGVKEFCIKHGINRAGFYKWQSRYKDKPDQSVNPAGFADLHITSSTLQGSLFAEVQGIKIYQPVAAAYLKELLLQ